MFILTSYTVRGTSSIRVLNMAVLFQEQTFNASCWTVCQSLLLQAFQHFANHLQ
jgi:hypothetical protein